MNLVFLPAPLQEDVLLGRMKATERGLREVLKDPGDKDLAALQQKIDACFASADYTEGRTAFMEKRTPDFKGR